MSASPDSSGVTPAKVVTDAAYAEALGFAGGAPVPADLPGRHGDGLSSWPPQGDQEFTRPELNGGSRQLLTKAEPLYLRGDPAAHAFLVEAGLLSLTMASRPGRERVIGLAGPGELIGMHSAGQRNYLESAVALSQEVSLLRVPAAATAEGPLVRLLDEAALRHLERLTDQLEDTELPVPARVARTFLRLAERFGQPNDLGAIRLTLPLTHDTLASLVGAARETTSTTVQQLRDLGLVTGTRGRYLVQRSDLQEFAVQAAMA